MNTMDLFRSDLSVLYDNEHYIEPLLTSVEWSGDVTQAHRTATFSVLNTADGEAPIIKFRLGAPIRLSDKGTELFRGFIFSIDAEQNGATTLTAYDENIYLSKNNDSRRFVNQKASDIIRTLCVDFGIAYGDIADTGHVIPKLILRNMSLRDMMITALTVTKKQNRRRFFLYCDKGKLQLVERKARVVEYVLESAATLTAASYHQSIEDTRNQVRVVSQQSNQATDSLGNSSPLKGEISATMKDPDAIKQYGLMQHYEEASSDSTTAEIQQLARQLLAELSKAGTEATVETLGLSDVYAGVCVYVYDKMTGLSGAYYVQTDSHRFENGTHTMTLTISKTDDLPELDYTDPEPVAKKKKSNSKSTNVRGLSEEEFQKALARLSSKGE